MLQLQGMTPAGLVEAVEGVPIEEARRIVGAIHRHGDLSRPVRGVRRSTLDRVRATGTVPSLALRATHYSGLDPFVKYSLESHDGAAVETVRIPLERAGRFSVCVSSQAGCGLGCSFCATGRMGLRRNLHAWEIVEQVRVVRATLDLRSRQRVHGLVFQGMGEPLANLDNVIQAIRVACEPSGLAIDGRCVTVSTAGLPAGIRRLARELPKVRLGLSIASPRHDVRAALMPITRAHPLDEVLDAAIEHTRITGLAPMWSYTLLQGVNDSDQEAHALAALARGFRSNTGLRPRLSIIAYNTIAPEGRDPFSPSYAERERAFRNVLSHHGFPSHKRYSGGADVAAACGQLAGAAGQQGDNHGRKQD
jgi:23S rRNA (adenine2503-C2)-methyltransferase